MVIISSPRMAPPAELPVHYALALSPIPVICAGIASLICSETGTQAQVVCADWAAWRRLRAARRHEPSLAVVHPGSVLDAAELAGLIASIGRAQIILALPTDARFKALKESARIQQLPLGAPLALWRHALKTAVACARFSGARADNTPGSSTDALARSPSLTPRQAEVLELLTHGFSNVAIARHLGISLGTAKLHVAAVLRALSARRRVDLVLRRAAGLLPAAARMPDARQPDSVTWPLLGD